MKKGDPLGFINILSVAKYQKIRKGDSFETVKIFEKKFAQCRKKLKGGTLESSGFVGYVKKVNQSRICGKGVGLSLFPSDSRSFESYEQFVRKSKKSKNDCFFGHFWAKFGYVSHISAIRI